VRLLRAEGFLSCIDSGRGFSFGKRLDVPTPVPILLDLGTTTHLPIFISVFLEIIIIVIITTIDISSLAITEDASFLTKPISLLPGPKPKIKGQEVRPSVSLPVV
jgi:hypothetical protein